VRDEARELAAERGTSVAEEAPAVARRHVFRDYDEAAAEDRKRQASRSVLGEFVELEIGLVEIKRRLARLRKIAADINLDDPNRESALKLVAECRAEFEMLASGLNAASVDWDAATADLT
jgi:hypothetical protein